MKRSTIWKDKKVLITGHTGFKGAWLSLILQNLGAKVYGLSLAPTNSRALYLEAQIRNTIEGEIFGDVRNEADVSEIFSKVEFEYIFHLAAQSLVINSYLNPMETISTNVIGTANVLTRALQSKSVRGISIITTDKVYENKDWAWPYREVDRLGGKDVYSASKSAAELLVRPLVNIFDEFKIPVTTLRAGNVIGGGDWAENRLIPDIVRASIDKDDLQIRNPNSTRPWQHVLDCLNGYLMLAEHHLADKSLSSNSVNFGPSDNLSVLELISIFAESYPNMPQVRITENIVVEHSFLQLDSSIARQKLKWNPRFTTKAAIAETADWYVRYLSGQDVFRISMEAIERFGFEE